MSINDVHYVSTTRQLASGPSFFSPPYARRMADYRPHGGWHTSSNVKLCQRPFEMTDYCFLILERDFGKSPDC